MHDFVISLSEEVFSALKLDPDRVPGEVRLAAAMKFYELGRLSSGAAAQLAGIPRAVFLSKLADYGVATFRQTEEELRQELANG